MDIDLLMEEARELLGLSLSDEQARQLERYAHLLVEWNARFNLTALRTPQDIRIKHFFDSLSCLTAMPEPAGRVADVGTGAGFPGLVLKIARPEIRLTLVESVAKKAEFCRHVVATLQLADVVVLPERAETLGKHPDHREAYDWAVARALAPMPVLAEYLLPLVKVGGHMLAQKGAAAPTEIDDGQNAVSTLGGELVGQREVRLPGVIDAHWLIVYLKARPTPSEYPRRTGVPGKKPL